MSTLPTIFKMTKKLITLSQHLIPRHWPYNTAILAPLTRVFPPALSELPSYSVGVVWYCLVVYDAYCINCKNVPLDTIYGVLTDCRLHVIERCFRLSSVGCPVAMLRFPERTNEWMNKLIKKEKKEWIDQLTNQNFY